MAIEEDTRGILREYMSSSPRRASVMEHGTPHPKMTIYDSEENCVAWVWCMGTTDEDYRVMRAREHIILDKPSLMP